MAITMGAAASLFAAWGGVHAEDLAPFAGRSVAVKENFRSRGGPVEGAAELASDRG